MKIDVILGADGQVVGVHVDGRGTYFEVEEPYVHSMPMDSGWRVRRYTVDPNTWPDGSPIDQVASRDEVDRLLEASSLGTPEANRLRASVGPALVAEALRRARLRKLTQESQETEELYREDAVE